MGIGSGSGDAKAQEAARAALGNPLLEETAISGAKNLLISVTGGPDMGILDFEEVMNYVKETCTRDAHIISGYRIDESMGDSLTVTVVATGYETEAARCEREAVETEQREKGRGDYLSFPEFDEMIKSSSKKPFRGDELDVPTVIRQYRPPSGITPDGEKKAL
jgi:cell division protein FtsZ